ncbi:AsmA family protein [Cellvibrio sp.]|uniref:AsmA family protein n=1 Tax=Cellvibrio sp. TaxID=1965322 RepID=UPI00396480E1
MSVKSVLKITGFVCATIVSAIIILILVVDANTFKPRIQALAADHGVALNMRGDLRWAFWPSIGLAVKDVSVAPQENPQAILADVKSASLLVAFIPLLKGDVQVKHVLVDGAVVNLSVNEQGVGNWETLVKKKELTTPTASAPAPAANDKVNGKKDLQLSIEKISIHDTRINYEDLAKHSKLTLNKINLDVKDVNLKNKPFELNAEWQTLIEKAANPLEINSKLKTEIAVDENFSALNLDKGELSLDIRAKDSTALKLQYSLNLKDLKNNLSYNGKLIVSSLNAKEFMTAFGVHYKTANEKALTDISLTTDLAGDKKQLALTNTNVKVDKTNLNGSIAVTDFSTQKLVINLKGDDINADDYLPPPLPTPVPAQNQTATANTATPVPAAVAKTTGDEPLVPVELLRKLNGDAKLALNSLVFSKIRMEKVLLDVDAKQGVVQQSLNANVYSGSLHTKNSVDARSANPQLHFDVILKGVDIAPILKEKGFDKKMQLTGILHANASGQASGVSINQIMDSLVGSFNFSGDKMRLAPLNVEQQFCKAVTLVTQEDLSQTTWNAYTELQKLSGKASIAKRIITVESVSGNVEKLNLGTTGTINLVSGSYDFLLPLKLNRDANDTPTSITTSAQGCKVNSNYWVERSMTLLRCKGAYAQMEPTKDCRPDKDQLNGLIKDFAAYKLKEKHGAKIEEKKSELLKKLDEKLGGEGKAEKTKDLLKSLFKKKEDKPKDAQ